MKVVLVQKRNMNEVFPTVSGFRQEWDVQGIATWRA